MATIVEVARRAGVSVSTVSHVVNRTRYVSPATARLVNEAIAHVGYLPNTLARSLKALRRAASASRSRQFPIPTSATSSARWKPSARVLVLWSSFRTRRTTRTASLRWSRPCTSGVSTASSWRPRPLRSGRSTILPEQTLALRVDRPLARRAVRPGGRRKRFRRCARLSITWPRSATGASASLPGSRLRDDA